MDSDSLSILASFAETLKDLGLTGGLLMGIIAFMKGWVLPRSHLDEMKEHSEAQTKLLAQEITREFVKGVKEAASEGAKAGAQAALEHINGGHK